MDESLRTPTSSQAGSAAAGGADRFRLLFERSTDPILLINGRTERFLDCNPAAFHTLGYASKDELLSLPPWSLSPEHQPDGKLSRTRATEILAEVRVHGSARFEWVHLSKRRGEIPVEIVLTLVEQPGEDPLIVVIWRDISERKRAEQTVQELNAHLEQRVAERTAELERANAQLVQAERELLKLLAREKELNDLKSSFVSMVSHEFRTPLAVILSSTNLLMNHLRRLSDDQREAQLREIQNSTRHMSHLIDEVLVLGRAEAGRMKCVPAEFDLAAFCSALVDESLSATERRSPIELRVKALRGEALGDQALLRHIFSNLLSNAVKYSAPGSAVQFTVEREGDVALFTVTDRGIGIPAADRPRIFEAFQRASNVGTINGNGLGLLIVKRCTELHSGSLELASTEGEGTTVTVRIPLFAKPPTKRPRKKRSP